MNKRLEIINHTNPEYEGTEYEGMYAYQLKYYVDDELVFDENEIEPWDTFKHFCNKFGYKQFLDLDSGPIDFVSSFAELGIEVVSIDGEPTVFTEGK